jgi:hypothetical protein
MPTLAVSGLTAGTGRRLTITALGRQRSQYKGSCMHVQKVHDFYSSRAWGLFFRDVSGVKVSV